MRRTTVGKRKAGDDDRGNAGIMIINSRQNHRRCTRDSSAESRGVFYFGEFSCFSMRERSRSERRDILGGTTDDISWRNRSGGRADRDGGGVMAIEQRSK